MRQQIKKEEEIKGKVLEKVRLYPWGEIASVVLLFENNEAAIFELFEFEDSPHMNIVNDNIEEIWDFSGMHHVGLITDEEYENSKREDAKQIKESRYKWYLELKKEFESAE